MTIYGLQIRPLYVFIFTILAVLLNIAQCGLQLSEKDKSLKPLPIDSALVPKSYNEFKGTIKDVYFYTSVNYLFKELPKSIKVIKDVKKAEKSALVNSNSTQEQLNSNYSSYIGIVTKFKTESQEYHQALIYILPMLLLFGWLPISLMKKEDKSFFDKLRFVIVTLFPIILISFAILDYYISVKYNVVIFDNNSSNEYKISLNKDQFNIHSKKWVRIASLTGVSNLKIEPVRISERTKKVTKKKIFIPTGVRNLIYNINGNNQYFRDSSKYSKRVIK